MPETAGWQFDIEVHPAGWAFPGGDSWLAGWIGVSEERYAADLRVWIDDRPFLGLPGLPKPGLDERFLGRAGPPYTGFTARVSPHRGARVLRLEVRDPAGRWTELFRTAITTAPDAPLPPPAPDLAPRAAELLEQLLHLRALHPLAPWGELSDEVVSSALAVPLDCLPNPPFHGALEEPAATGRVGYGRLTVTGWLSHRDSRIKHLTAITDGLNETPLLHGLARGDVGTVFPDMPGRERSQFVGQADLMPDGTEPVLLKVFAELDSGGRHLVFAQRLSPRITAGPGLPWPPHTRRTLWAAVWALRSSARRHGARLGAWGRLLAAGRRIAAAYRDGAPTARPAVPAPTATSPAKPLRILAVSHNLNFEGAPRLLFELLRYLARDRGHAIRVLSPQDGPLRHLYAEAGIPVELVDVSAALQASTPEDFHRGLAAAAHRDWAGIDLVVANTMVAFWGVHLAAAAGKPSLLYVHESAPVARFFAPLLPAALHPLVEEAFRRATRVAFTAEASRRVFSRLDPRGRFHVLPSWLDVAALDAFAAAHGREELRRRHGIGPAATVLLNLGTVCDRKGQHVFIRAAGLLAAGDASRPPEFVMVGARGDGYETILRAQAADAGLRHVRFVPETRENLDWLRLADLLVCTSLEESSPRVILEAAAMGLPIVTTDVNGIPELVTEQEAWLTPPGDARALARTLRAALAALAAGDRARADRARERVVRLHDERVSLPQHAALVNEVGSARS